MSVSYESCGGCGAETPAERCIGCLHDFGDGPLFPSQTPEAAGLEVVGWVKRINESHPINLAQPSDWKFTPHKPVLPEGLQAEWFDEREVVTAASAQAAIDAEKAKVAELEARIEYLRGSRDGHAAHAHSEFEARVATEARADRLAKALEPFAVPHECDGHATVEDFNMEVQIFVRWSVIKAARAALQQETQP